MVDKNVNIDVNIYDEHFPPKEGSDHLQIVTIEHSKRELWIRSYGTPERHNNGTFIYQRFGIKEVDDLITVLTYWKKNVANAED